MRRSGDPPRPQDGLAAHPGRSGGTRAGSGLWAPEAHQGAVWVEQGRTALAWPWRAPGVRSTITTLSGNLHAREVNSVIDRELRGSEADAFLKQTGAELQKIWEERHAHERRGEMVPLELERAYLQKIADILYVGAHLNHRDGVGHIPPGVAIKAAEVFNAALAGRPSAAFRPTGGSAPSPDMEADQRIGAELVILSGYGGERWLDLPTNFVDMVADKFGVTRPAVTSWVTKYRKTIDGTLRKLIEHRTSRGVFPSREAAALHDLDVASSHFRSWRHDAQNRSATRTTQAAKAQE